MIALQGSGPDGGSSETTTASTTTSTTTAQGNGREKNTGPIPIPGAGRLAGAPVATARRFMAVWLNRIPTAPAVRRARPLLVGLSTGNFAELLQVTALDALKSGDFGPANRGSVEFAKLESSGPRSASVLLVCRETPQGGGETFTTYLAKLAAVAPGRFAISDLEPQS